jgi:glycosyltransferase involved in cell wall biosynthesis
MFNPKFFNKEIRLEYYTGDDDILVGYLGLHGLAQGLEVVVDAAEKLRDTKSIKFILVGEGPTKLNLIERANDKKLTNITFYNGRPKADMPKILASLDISLVPLSGRFPGTMPSKVYEALASGTPPIVAKACEGDALVSQYNAGRTYEPMDADDLVRAIADLTTDRQEYEKVKQNGIMLSMRFDRAVIADRTEKILTAIHNGAELPSIDW